MKLIIIYVLVALAMFASDCASYYPAEWKVGSISYNNSADKMKYSRVYVWESDVNAGAGNERGVCVQSALTDSISATKFNADALEALRTGEIDIETAQNLLQLQPSNTQTTYANTAYFAICQIALNNPKISNADLVEMFKQVGQDIRYISVKTSDAQTLNAPALSELVRSNLQARGLPVADEAMDSAVTKAMRDLGTITAIEATPASSAE